MVRSKKHADYNLLAQVVTGEGIGEYQSMTDLDTSSGSSSGNALDSEFTITHLPIGLGYESQ
jgi:hypothetical protein